MKIVGTSNTYRIYGDDLQTYNELPAATYKIDFHPMAGFYLVKIDNFESKEEKVYGSHKEKIQKVLRSYQKFDRSLGIILSGNKGMGKSMFVQQIGEEVVKMGIPVIMVTKAFPGIADFIEEIDQEVLVVFDEFEKMFNLRSEAHRDNNTKIESQDNLLGLFDGTSQKKRMYALTVNNLRQVNEFMLSRPGRFHYHIRFDYPSASEIETYLKDKVEAQYHGEISHVVSFANRVKLNYDSLRAIAFELNEGYSFRSAIGDLNILMTDSQRYDINIAFADGRTCNLKNQNLNLFSDVIRLEGYLPGREYFSVTFDPAAIVEDMLTMIVSGEAVHVEAQDEEGDPTDDVEISRITITHSKEVGVNYHLGAV